MPGHFEGARLKLARADEHFGSLHAETNAYMASAVGSRHEFHPTTGFRSIRLALSSPPAARWGLIAGDIASNLRAVLDHLVYELAGTSASFETEFPISIDEQDYLRPRHDRAGKPRPSKREAALAGVPDRYCDLIDDKQPFKAGKKARDHPLAVLAAFNNADKHRFAHPAIARLTEHPKLVALDGKTYLPAYPPKGKRLNDGDDLCTFHDPAWRPGQGSSVEVRLDMTFEVAFGERPLGDVEMGQIGNYVAGIYNGFVALSSP